MSVPHIETKTSKTQDTSYLSLSLISLWRWWKDSISMEYLCADPEGEG